MLKKISVVMCAGLFAVALAACGKKDGGSSGCDDLAKKAMADKQAEMPKDMPADQKKMFDEMNKKGADLVAKHCKEDKWSADVIKCGKESKNPEECMEKLTADQQKKFMDDAMKMMGGGAMPKEEVKEEPKEEPKPAEGEGSGSAAAPEGGEGSGSAAAPEGAAAGTGLPDCDAYIAATEKYMSCDKVPQQARDSAKQGIEAMKQGWGDMAGMPEDVKKQTNDACKQGVDALKQGAAAMGCEI